MIDLLAPFAGAAATLLLFVRWLQLARADAARDAERLEAERRQLVEQLALQAMKRRWQESQNRTGVVHAGRRTITTVDRRPAAMTTSGYTPTLVHVAPSSEPLERSVTPPGYMLARRLPGPLWRRWYARQLP